MLLIPTWRLFPLPGKLFSRAFSCMPPSCLCRNVTTLGLPGHLMAAPSMLSSHCPLHFLPSTYHHLILLCLFSWFWGASLVAQMVKKPPAMWETWVQSLGREDPLEEGMATHSNIAWRIPWTEELAGYSPGGLQRVGHDWVTKNSIHFQWNRMLDPLPSCLEDGITLNSIAWNNSWHMVDAP